MRRIFRKLLEILDNTPAEYGEQQRGQSVVEMALLTPLLIVLFASMVEIGWFANNYLTLLDVTRAGARRGTTLQDTLDPLQWDERASQLPDNWLDRPDQAQYRITDPDLDGDGDPDGLTSAELALRANYRAYDAGAGRCQITGGTVGFYNEVACLMIQSLDPLRLNDRIVGSGADQRLPMDDIVISAFSIELVPTRHLGTPPDTSLDPDVPQAAIVGRYPRTANECEVGPTGDVYGASAPQRDRDPFDFDGSGTWTVNPLLGDALSNFDSALVSAGLQEIGDYEELPGFDPPRATLATADAAERQVGFIWFGNHVIQSDPDFRGCLGSEWTIAEVEAFMNLPQFLGSPGIDADAVREMLPSQGLVLVEMFWEHRPLLNLPFFEPIFRAFGERTIVNVWAMFPLPQTEPFILFPEP